MNGKMKTLWFSKEHGFQETVLDWREEEDSKVLKRMGFIDVNRHALNEQLDDRPTVNFRFSDKRGVDDPVGVAIIGYCDVVDYVFVYNRRDMLELRLVLAPLLEQDAVRDQLRRSST